MAQQNFSETYKETVFVLWHEGNRKLSDRFCNSLPDENGDRPSPKTVEKWRDNFGWIERAESLDVDFSNKLIAQSLNKREEMYKRHEEVASALLTKGEEYLKEHDFKDSADAIRAIGLAVEISRASVGQAEIIRKFASMSEEQLDKELQKMISKPEDGGEFIDAISSDVEED